MKFVFTIISIWAANVARSFIYVCLLEPVINTLQVVFAFILIIAAESHCGAVDVEAEVVIKVSNTARSTEDDGAISSFRNFRRRCHAYFRVRGLQLTNFVMGLTIRYM